MLKQMLFSRSLRGLYKAKVFLKTFAFFCQNCLSVSMIKILQFPVRIVVCVLAYIFYLFNICMIFQRGKRRHMCGMESAKNAGDVAGY